MAQKPSAVLIGDALALDFLNSVINGPDSTVDLLTTGDGLLCWMAQARMIDARRAEEIRQARAAAELDDIASRARELREWFRTFVMTRKGRKLTAEDLVASEPLNEILRMDVAFTRLVPCDRQVGLAFRLETVRRTSEAMSLLVAIAETLAHFICEGAFARIKMCQGPGCSLLFEDKTRGLSRRWCSMLLCGNTDRHP